jgi:hypothetical protein
MIYFDSDMSKSTNTVVYSCRSTRTHFSDSEPSSNLLLLLSGLCLAEKQQIPFFLEDGNLYLRLRKISHTIYATNGKVSHIQRCMC